MIRRRAFILSLVLTLLLALVVAPLAHAVTQEDLRAHEEAARKAREAAEAAEDEADRLAKEVAKLDQAIDSMQGELDELSRKVAEATKRTNRLKAEVNALRAQVNAKQAEIEATQAEYEHQQALLAGRIQETYKNGDFLYLELLLESRSLDDLITRTALVQRVIKSNAQLAVDLKTTRIALEKLKTGLERDLQAVDAKRAEAQTEENRLRSLKAQQQAKLNEQEAAKRQKAELVAENRANAKRLRALAEAEEKESARIAAELYGQGSGYFAGEMAWPVPGFYRITSPYGYRIHPIFGSKELHTGIDIGRSIEPPKSIDGATVVAAGDGTVYFAGYRGGYGNTVIIDHGNGVATLYAHMQSGSIAVGTGQTVSRGQTVGRVGSTGYSTGPHMHFEVRVNGAPVDPMQYLQ